MWSSLLNQTNMISHPFSENVLSNRHRPVEGGGLGDYITAGKRALAFQNKQSKNKEGVLLRGQERVKTVYRGKTKESSGRGGTR